MKKETNFSGIEIPIYDIINESEFLLIPAANMVAGAVGFGLPGALAGIVIGMLDETLVSFNWTNGRYLSPIIQGVSSFATLTTSLYAMVAGGVLSLIFSHLVISEYSEHIDKMNYPIKTALQAGYVFGLNGAIASIVLSSMEEVLIQYEIYNKHYISTAISFVSIIHILKEKTGSFLANYMHKEPKLSSIFILWQKLEGKIPYFLESMVSITSVIYSIYQAEELNITVLEFQKEMREIYRKLGKEEEYHDIFEKQVLTTLGFTVAEQFLYYKLMGCLQKSTEAFYGKLMDLQVWRNYKLFSKEILLVLPWLIAIKQIFIKPVESYFSFKSQELLYGGVGEKWLVGEVPLKILQKEDAEVLIDNLYKDIAVITDSGEALRKSYFNDVLKSAYSQYLMYQYNAQDLIIIYQVYYGCTQYVSESLSRWQASYNNEIRAFESKRNTIIKHDARNVETVVGRGGVSYSAAVLKELNDELKSLKTKQLTIKHLCKTWNDIEEYTDIIFTCFSVGYKTHIGKLNPDMRLKVLVATGSIASLMSWTGKNAGTVEEVKISLEKLNTFINKIEDVEDVGEQSLQLAEHTKEEIVFENLRLTIGNAELFYAPQINLKLGVYCALTGDSGSGKSSLLSKIKGIMYNGIVANGVIKYPYELDQAKEIVLMPQSDFFPIDTTLLEAIYYPKRIDLYQKKEIYDEVFKMLQKLELCSEDNDNKKNCNIKDFMENKRDWSNVLSGGQKKKVLLVSALMQKSKILLLDEPFTGLHQEAIPVIQSFIKETLENTSTLVICIDHHVSDSRNFYDFELYVKNKQLKLQKFQSKDDILSTQEELVEEKKGYRVIQVDEKYKGLDENYNPLLNNTDIVEENI